MAQRSELLGAHEFAAVLRELPERLQRNALSSVSLAGARALQRRAYVDLTVAMQSRSAREDDVIVKKRRSPRGSVQSIHEVGPPSYRPELRWLHNGTQAHRISATDYIRTSTSSRHKAGRQVGRNASNGRGNILSDRTTIFGREVVHPGQPPRPWLETAVYRSEGAVIEAAGAKLRQVLPKQVRKLVSEKYRNATLRRLARRRI